MTITKLNKSIISCRLCSRLVNFREKIAKEKRRQYINEIYWGKPITGYGDPEAKLLKGKSLIKGRETINNNPYSRSSYKSSTIQRILASITYKYRVNGFPFDRKNPNISETISAIVRDEKNQKSGQARELLKNDIVQIIDTIPNNNEDLRNIRDKALILMGFYSFCRRSELLGMKFEHLNFGDDGIQILIPFSKTKDELVLSLGAETLKSQRSISFSRLELTSTLYSDLLFIGC